jgi:hypothetical protein
MKYLIFVLLLSSCASDRKVPKDGDIYRVTHTREVYTCEYDNDFWVFDTKLDRDNFCK